jgi:2-oxoisovalerate dehydrogenase E1 component beta subunit
MKPITYIEAITLALREEMRRDDRVCMLGEDIGPYGGVFKATQGLNQEFGDLRVLDSPLSESLIVGASVGAAIAGMRPVPEIQFSDFITCAFDQIVEQASRMLYRTGGAVSVPMTVRVPFGGEVGGGLYHSQCNEAWFAHCPGLIVVCPGTPYDAKGLLTASIRNENPVIYFEHKKLYRSLRAEVPEDDYIVPIGKAEVRRPGKKMTLVAYSLMLHKSLEAAERVAQKGIDVEVIDLRTIYPWDKDLVLESVKKTGRLLIVHEDIRTCGIGGDIAAVAADEAFEYLDAPIKRVTPPEVPTLPFAPVMEQYFMPSVDRIQAQIEELVAY